MKPKNGWFETGRTPPKVALWCAILYSFLFVSWVVLPLLSQDGWRRWAQFGLAFLMLPIAVYNWVLYVRARRRDG
ncbi:hypothetical protein VSH64_38575 [Amycolatopsis rhabdoformis]|uniref:DUF2530 domain-containing protein n=1 Tax=Amycolatopsis rhabdoformis TaxID=1448059 RepID=A0ABZ1I417_9PSEU|nr:hypothetical protein [Amycolatopsis rhabdoformis]WSE28686.1 hypothetical protein VSH64_38575 [Amycolatopsis rhabdoformis]